LRRGSDRVAWWAPGNQPRSTTAPFSRAGCNLEHVARKYFQISPDVRKEHLHPNNQTQPWMRAAKKPGKKLALGEKAGENRLP